MDSCLAAKGWILDRYMALTQRPIEEHPGTIADQILGRDGFATLLRSGRERLGRTLAEVAAALSQRNLMVRPDQLGHWELGNSVASLQHENVIRALDQLYECKGSLLQAWAARSPRNVLSRYRLDFKEWPARVQDQYQRLVRYKTDNPENLPLSGALTGDRWRSPANVRRIMDYLGRYFGFLVRSGFPQESLSLSLLADVALVVKFHDYVLARTHKESKGYSADVITFTKVSNNLLEFFLPHLAVEVSAESHWQGRLPSERVERVEVAAGVFREERHALKTRASRWTEQLAQAHHWGLELLRDDNRFRTGSMAGRTAEFHDCDGVLEQIMKLLRAAIAGLPLRIQSVEAAAHCRRMAGTAILVAQAFRPGNIRGITLERMRGTTSKVVQLSLPASAFKARGRGGSEAGFHGPLSDDAILHHVVYRYLQEARPILVGPTDRDRPDEGYLLTSLPVRTRNQVLPRPGRCLTSETLRRDIQRVLGYHAYGHRFVVAMEGALQGIALKRVAELLGHQLQMTESVYGKLPPKVRSRLANDLLGQMAVAMESR